MLIINDILAFIIELVAIILYAMTAYQLSENRVIKILLVISTIIVFAFLWGRFFAPSATNPLQGWIRWVLEFVILFTPWPLYFQEKYGIITLAGVIIIVNLMVQALIGRSNLG